jgi:hypothetical protein
MVDVQHLPSDAEYSQRGAIVDKIFPLKHFTNA